MNGNPMHFVNRKSQIVNGDWLPDMDLNHDKQIQSLLCYRYTIGQAGASRRLSAFPGQSSGETAVPQRRETIAHGFNRRLASQKEHEPRRGGRKTTNIFGRPFGIRVASYFDPRLKPWAILGRPAGALN